MENLACSIPGVNQLECPRVDTPFPCSPNLHLLYDESSATLSHFGGRSLTPTTILCLTFHHHSLAGQLHAGSSLRALHSEHILPGLVISDSRALCSRKRTSRPTGPLVPTALPVADAVGSVVCAQVLVNYRPGGGGCAAGRPARGALKSLTATYLTALKGGASGSVPTTTSSPTCRPQLQAPNVRVSSWLAFFFFTVALSKVQELKITSVWRLFHCMVSLATLSHYS